MNKKDYTKQITILTVLTIIFTLLGSTFAYWTWTSSNNTLVTFTVEPSFSCSADGGGDITSSDVAIVPTTCTNSEHAIMRTVKTSMTIKDNMDVSMNLWLDVNNLDSGLSNSKNFRYALTTSNTSCTTGVIASGSFNGITNGEKVNLLTSQTFTSSATDTYYLYIWLDSDETSTSTMNQNFNLSLNGNCTSSPSGISESISIPSEPVLDEGMIPVTISNDGKVTTISEDNTGWYDYSEQQWANAVLVSNSSRSTYKDTNGVSVNTSDILGYYVWIPRYKYSVSEMSCSELSDVNETDYPSCYSINISDTDKSALITMLHSMFATDFPDYTITQATSDINNGLTTGTLTVTIIEVGNPSISMLEFIEMINQENTEDPISYTTEFAGSNTLTGPRTINIVFEDTTTPKSTGTGSGTSYRTHPAFTFDGEELNGIWVGKFETTGSATTPTVLPNTSPLVSQKVSAQFTSSLLFSGGSMNTTSGDVTFSGSSTYGLANTTDSHMMKNSEWGAVTYLSHSKYGINEEIRINNYYSSGLKTGCGASTADAESSSTCEIAYGGATAYPQSTTGNISGIFDMSGGTWEYVMGVLADESGEPRSGYSTNSNSGFNGTVYDDGADNSYSSGISFPNEKYYDLYETSDATTACSGGVCYGHALSETAMWYNDIAGFVDSSFPWFLRGGYYLNGSDAGAFYFVSVDGHAFSYYSWRSVLVAG